MLLCMLCYGLVNGKIDLELLISSAWRETKTREYRITVNSNGSQMLQKMVEKATAKQLRRYMHRIDKM
jgi:hypothetical protein